MGESWYWLALLVAGKKMGTPWARQTSKDASHQHPTYIAERRLGNLWMLRAQQGWRS